MAIALPFFFCHISGQCMHITERLLDICYFLENDEKKEG